MSKLKVTLGGAEALFAAAFFFALTNVLVREMSHMWGDQAQVAARFILVWLLLTAYVYIRRRKVAIPKSKITLVVVYSVLAAVAILLFTLSLQMTTIANTLFTSTAVELVIAFVLGTVILKEKVTWMKIFAIGLSLVGLVLYSGALLSGNTGIILALFAGIAVAACNLIAKKLKGVNLTSVLRMQFGIGAILMIVLTLLFSSGDIVRTVSLEGVVVTIVFALILISATHLVLYGFQHFDVNIASVILSSQLAMSALLGYLLYQEMLTPSEVMSGLLITAAAIMSGIEYKRRSKEIDIHG